MKMASIIFYTMTIFILINVGYISSKAPTKSDLFLGRYPIPPNIPTSINIISSQVKKNILTPVIIYIASASKIVEMINTGKSIEIHSKYIDDVAFITGGPYGLDVYTFHLLRIYWSRNATGPASTTIDGSGCPLFIENYYYNIKYGSFQNALQHRDGIAQINREVKVGSTTGVTFIPMANALKRVRKAHSKTEISVFNAIIWFEYPVLLRPYYTYPGSFTDDAGKTYECTTVIMYPPRILPVMSPQQFQKSFGMLENEQGEPLVNVDPAKPSTTPVVQSVGTIQSYI